VEYDGGSVVMMTMMERVRQNLNWERKKPFSGVKLKKILINHVSRKMGGSNTHLKLVRIGVLC
jgi:hypothetical protein